MNLARLLNSVLFPCHERYSWALLESFAWRLTVSASVQFKGWVGSCSCGTAYRFLDVIAPLWVVQIIAAFKAMTFLRKWWDPQKLIELPPLPVWNIDWCRRCVSSQTDSFAYFDMLNNIMDLSAREWSSVLMTKAHCQLTMVQHQHCYISTAATPKIVIPEASLQHMQHIRTRKTNENIWQVFVQRW